MNHAQHWSEWWLARLPNRNRGNQVLVSVCWWRVAGHHAHWTNWPGAPVLLAVHSYAKNNMQVAEYFITHFRNTGIAIPLLKGLMYYQVALEKVGNHGLLHWGLRVYQSLLKQSFYCYAVMSSSIKGTGCRIAQVCPTGTQSDLRGQPACKAWRLHLEKGWLASIFRCICAVYVIAWVSSSLPTTIKHSKGLLSLQHEDDNAYCGSSLMQGEGVEIKAFKMVVARGDALG